MTTIAYRNGVMAADSRITFEDSSAGTRLAKCEKLFRVKDAIIGLHGESSPGLIFLDWYRSGKRKSPEGLVSSSADFGAMVLTKSGLYLFDKWCRGEKVIDEFWAMGSGSKAALGAMHQGASAIRAVEVACRVDPYTAGPIVSMRLGTGRALLFGGESARRKPAR